MTFALSDTLEERWAEYLRLREQNAHYSAFVRLGEIANCVRYAEASAKFRSRWKELLVQIDISTDVLRSIKVEAMKEIERLERVVGSGGEHTYEEALLVITSRVELSMLLSYLDERGVAEFVDTSAVDERLREAASSPQNFFSFRSAERSAKRNWGLPLRSKWLRTDAIH